MGGDIWIAEWVDVCIKCNIVESPCVDCRIYFSAKEEGWRIGEVGRLANLAEPHPFS